ncbi:MAG TPA: hypothetical protein VHM92_00245 [Allosphingosinicella sp.]|nr:hypothetical protein [Allosphingosinicella sp.]
MATASGNKAWTAALPGLPERVPDFGPKGLLLFRLIWFPAFLLAVAGPLAGTWYRLTAPSQNSALVAGSRAGLALAEQDLTRVRYPVGPAAAGLGIRPGDDIVAVDSIPVSAAVPMPGTAAARLGKATEADLALFGDLLYGAESRDVQLTLRGRDGRTRDVVVTTGEGHVEAGARALGIPPRLLAAADLLHLLTYPFLLVSAWVLYRRKIHDVVSSLLSLAILLTLGAEQPSAAFLELVAHVPPQVHRLLYDLGNVLLLAAVMLFPHGRLAPRPILAAIATLPVLFLLQGDTYRTVFMAYMGASVVALVWRLRTTPQGEERQQLKWALFGFSGYAVFLTAALAADMAKLQAGSLSGQLALEVFAGFAFGLAFLLLQLGLLVALMRYRLYDAETVITRSASVAVITLALAGIFAATMEGVKMVVQNAFGQSASNTAAIVGAAVSTVLVNPIYERAQAWAERRFHRRLVELRSDLPDCLRDLRHVATLPELLKEVLDRIQAGVRPSRIAALVGGRVVERRGDWGEEAEAAVPAATSGLAGKDGILTGNPCFPIRVPLRIEDGSAIGCILVGPRPDRSRLAGAEADALTEIARPVAGALRVVLAREAREKRIDEALAAQQRRLDAVAARVAIDPERPQG